MSAPTFDDAVGRCVREAMGAGAVVISEGRGEGVLTVPVADRGALAFATGLAIGGRPTVLEVSGTARLPALVEGLLEAGAIAVRGELPVPLVVRVAYGSEARGLDQPVGGWLLDLPGVRVVAASEGAQAVHLIREGLAGTVPTVVLEPRVLARDRRALGAPASSCRVLREGGDVVLAAFGASVHAALEAAEALAAEGTAATVFELVRLSPLDVEALGAHVRRAGRLVVAGDDAPFARRVREAALDGAFLYLESPLASSGASSLDIARAAREAVAY
jgi:2-oxoisovalerate dehydrogenase E1 component beta subunit